MQHFRSRESARYHLNVSTDAEAIKYYICTASVNAFDDPDEEILVQTQELFDNGSCAAILREWFLSPVTFNGHFEIFPSSYLLTVCFALRDLESKPYLELVELTILQIFHQTVLL